MNSKTLEFYLSVLSEDYDIVAIVESWLTPGVNSGELFDQRYQVFRQDRDPHTTGKSKGGGLIIAVKNNIKALPLTSLYQCERNIESMWVKCNIHGQDIILSLCYFPPPVKTLTMESFADYICQKEELLGSNLICLGDYNIPYYHPPGIEPTLIPEIDTSPDPEVFDIGESDLTGEPLDSDLIVNPPDINPGHTNLNPDPLTTPNDQYVENTTDLSPEFEARGALLHLHRVINFYALDSINTIKNYKGRTLDLCLTNFHFNKVSRKKVAKCFIEETDGLVNIDRNHPPLILFINLYKSTDTSSQSQSKSIKSDMPFNFNKTDFSILSEKLSSINWDNLYSVSCVDEKMKCFYAEMKKAFLLSTPLLNTDPKKETFPKWWHKNTIKMFRRKERIRKIHKKSAKQKKEYSILRKQCKTDIKKDYQTYINKVAFLVKKGNSKPFWDFTKQQRKEPPKKLLSYKDEQISDPQHIVNAFADHFKNAYNQTPPTYTTDLNIDTDPEHFHLSAINEQDVEHEVKQMLINKPAGPDGIPPKIISKCISHLKAPLAHIFSFSLQSRIFPSALKVSNVTPVPKKPGEVNISGHRPVSNQNVISKIFEGVIYSHISSFIFSKISPQQHGFVAKKSTIGNLIEFSDHVARAMSKKVEIHACYTDIEKCFDRLSHQAILVALTKAGFSKPNVEFFADYLKNRKIFVKYLNRFSSPITPPSGIIQGSKLSSLLFILTYNDVHKYVLHSEVLLYADDLKIFKVIQDQNDCQLLQDDINSVSRWLGSIGLNFHPAKCNMMCYSTSPTHNPLFTYHINDTPLLYVSHSKDLGIIFQSNLTFDKHRNEIEQKAFRRLGLVIRHSKSIPDPDVSKMLYLSLVRPILEYGSPIWLPRTECGKKSLERVQARFVRHLFHKENGLYPLFPNYIEYELLAENLPIDTLSERRLSEQMKLLQNICQGRSSSSYLIGKTELRVPNSRLRRSDKPLFHIPNTSNINTLMKSPLIYAFSTYNNMNKRPDLF